jgi:hypothetical protein
VLIKSFHRKYGFVVREKLTEDSGFDAGAANRGEGALRGMSSRADLFYGDRPRRQSYERQITP